MSSTLCTWWLTVHCLVDLVLVLYLTPMVLTLHCLLCLLLVSPHSGERNNELNMIQESSKKTTYLIEHGLPFIDCKDHCAHGLKHCVPN
jgi:hypothetical protein